MVRLPLVAEVCGSFLCPLGGFGDTAGQFGEFRAEVLPSVKALGRGLDLLTAAVAELDRVRDQGNTGGRPALGLVSRPCRRGRCYAGPSTTAPHQ